MEQLTGVGGNASVDDSVVSEFLKGIGETLQIFILALVHSGTFGEGIEGLLFFGVLGD